MRAHRRDYATSDQHDSPRCGVGSAAARLSEQHKRRGAANEAACVVHETTSAYDRLVGRCDIASARLSF